MPQMVRDFFALSADAGKHLHIIPGLKRRRKDLDHNTVAVPFVSGKVFADAAEGREGGFAFDQRVQNRVGIGHGIAVVHNDEPRGGFLVQSRPFFDLPALRDRSRAVDHKGKFLIGGEAESHGVGAEHIVNTEGRRDGRTGVGTGKAHAIGFRGHGGVVTGDAVMGGITDGGHPHTVFFRFFNGDLHGVVSDHLTHAVVAVDHRRRRRFFHDLPFGHGFLDPCFNAIQIDGFKAVHAVGINTAAIGFNQNIHADFRVFPRNAVSHKSVDHKVFHQFPINIFFRHTAPHKSLKIKRNIVRCRDSPPSIQCGNLLYIITLS